jgi:hypothetical protein
MEDTTCQHSSIERRIQKAYERMLKAKSECWRHAWGDGFVANVSARNAMRTVAEIRQLERERGLR